MLGVRVANLSRSLLAGNLPVEFQDFVGPLHDPIH